MQANKQISIPHTVDMKKIMRVISIFCFTALTAVSMAACTNVPSQSNETELQEKNIPKCPYHRCIPNAERLPCLHDDGNEKFPCIPVPYGEYGEYDNDEPIDKNFTYDGGNEDGCATDETADASEHNEDDTRNDSGCKRRKPTPRYFRLLPFPYRKNLL